MWNRNSLSLMSDFARIRREMDDLFGHLGGAGATSWNSGLGAIPALNVWEHEDTLRVEAEVPGVKLEDMEIFAVGAELTIKGRRVVSNEPKSGFLRRERGVGEFTRVITLPVEVATDKVEAVLQDGVLTITLPKAESAKPRRIALKAG